MPPDIALTLVVRPPVHCMQYASQNLFPSSCFIPLKRPIQVDRKTWPTSEEDRTPYSDCYKQKQETKSNANDDDEGCKA